MGTRSFGMENKKEYHRIESKNHGSVFSYNTRSHFLTAEIEPSSKKGLVTLVCIHVETPKPMHEWYCAKNMY